MLFAFFLTFYVVNLVITNSVQSITVSGASTSFTITSEGFPVLDALKIVTHSMHNCRVFGYYGGIQKLTTLMKGVLEHFFGYSFYPSAIDSLCCIIFDKKKMFVVLSNVDKVELLFVIIFCFYCMHYLQVAIVLLYFMYRNA